MRQILDLLTAYQEENSLAAEEVEELEELEGILEAVLAWHNEDGE